MLNANTSAPPKFSRPHTKGEPPERANAYSDGSVRHPISIFATATFGVVGPDMVDDDRSEQEQAFATQVDLGHLYRNAGLAVAGLVPGIFLSSARAELVGAIVALMTQSAITLKADNEGVISKALKHFQLGSSGRKPWSLHKDGDLWEMLFDTARSRGFDSFTMMWTKGHVTLKFLVNGSGQSRDAIYNSLADRAASKGYDLQHSRCAHALLDFFARKQQRYIHTIRSICTRIARVAQAAADKLEHIRHSETLGRNAALCHPTG